MSSTHAITLLIVLLGQAPERSTTRAVLLPSQWGFRKSASENASLCNSKISQNPRLQVDLAPIIASNTIVEGKLTLSNSLQESVLIYARDGLFYDRTKIEFKIFFCDPNTSIVKSECRLSESDWITRSDSGAETRGFLHYGESLNLPFYLSVKLAPGSYECYAQCQIGANAILDKLVKLPNKRWLGDIKSDKKRIDVCAPNIHAILASKIIDVNKAEVVPPHHRQNQQRLSLTLDDAQTPVKPGSRIKGNVVLRRFVGDPPILYSPIGLMRTCACMALELQWTGPFEESTTNCTQIHDIREAAFGPIDRTVDVVRGLRVDERLGFTIDVCAPIKAGKYELIITAVAPYMINESGYQYQAYSRPIEVVIVDR